MCGYYGHRRNPWKSRGAAGLPAIPRLAPCWFAGPGPTSTPPPGSNAMNAVERPQSWAGLHSYSSTGAFSEAWFPNTSGLDAEVNPVAGADPRPWSPPYRSQNLESWFTIGSQPSQNKIFPLAQVYTTTAPIVGLSSLSEEYATARHTDHKLSSRRRRREFPGPVGKRTPPGIDKHAGSGRCSPLGGLADRQTPRETDKLAESEPRSRSRDLG